VNLYMSSIMVVYTSVNVGTAAGVTLSRKKCALHMEKPTIIVGPRIILNGSAGKGAAQTSNIETSTNDVCTTYVTTMKTTTLVTPGPAWMYSLTPRKRGVYNIREVFSVSFAWIRVTSG